MILTFDLGTYELDTDTSTRPMSLKFHLFSFLSRNTLSQKHDVGILFTWAFDLNNLLLCCVTNVRPTFTIFAGGVWGGAGAIRV